jgi:hypothetical protein
MRSPTGGCASGVSVATSLGTAISTCVDSWLRTNANT